MATVDDRGTSVAAIAANKTDNIGKEGVGWVLLGPSNSPTHGTILWVNVRVMSEVAICKGRCRRSKVGGVVAGNVFRDAEIVDVAVNNAAS